MKQTVKVIKREEREKDPRIRPIVMRKMLLDEKSRLMRRVKQIDQTLRTVEA